MLSAPSIKRRLTGYHQSHENPYEVFEAREARRFIAFTYITMPSVLLSVMLLSNSVP